LWKLAAANQCNKQMQIALGQQKTEMAAEIRSLEGKLIDTEDCLLHKVREVAAARGVQSAIRMELDSLKTMIVGEEERSVC
jgi:hypothetical protein